MAGHDECCSCAHGSGVSQTLEELDFERGLWQAAVEGDEERVKSLLRGGNAVNAKDSAGYTPLHYACRAGHVTTCQTLITAGADINSQTPGGTTGMHRAAYCGHGDVVRVLVREGAEGGRTDSDGKTPLHKACEGDRMAVAEILVAAFPDTLSVRDNRGRLPRDVVPNWSPPWAHTLGDRDTET